MKTLVHSFLLGLVVVAFVGCATGPSSSQSSAAPKISGYIDTSVNYNSK